MAHSFAKVFYQVCQAGKASRQKKEEKLGAGHMCMVSDCLGVGHQVLGRHLALLRLDCPFLLQKCSQTGEGCSSS